MGFSLDGSRSGFPLAWLAVSAGAGAVAAPAKAPEARGACWGSSGVSPATAHFELASN